MCVYVCVIYIYSTFNLLHIIPDAGEIHIPNPFALPALRRLQFLPCYTLNTFTHPTQVLEFFSSCTSRLSPLDLTTPGREKCHHRPIRQLCLLSNARPFVTRAAEEQAVISHYR